MANFGEMSWDDDNTGKKSSSDIYMRLEQGINPVRILTKPYKYMVYFYGADDKGKGGSRVIACEDTTKDPIAALGIKPKVRFLMGIIDRKTQTYKILDAAYSVFKDINNLSNSAKWGKPTQYDINIKVDKNGAPSDYYAVIPDPKEPLSEADRAILAQVDENDLRERSAPLTPERMTELMEMIDKRKNEKSNPTVSTVTADKTPEVVSQTVSEIEVKKKVNDSDIDFPAFDDDDDD
jgi:hypothetical protein